MTDDHTQSPPPSPSLGDPSDEGQGQRYNTRHSQSASQTTPQKRKEPPSPASTSARKRKKNLTTEESQVIVDAYIYYKGNWRAIMQDKKVQALKRDEKNLKNHVEYVRTKKNRHLNPKSGTRLRASIVDTISRNAEREETEELIDNFENEEEQEVENGSQNYARSEHTLSPRSEDMHRYDEEQLADTVQSDEISSSQDYTERGNEMTRKEAVRNNRIRQKEKQHREVLNDIREQREERKDRSDMHHMLMVMMLKMQEQQQQQQQQLLREEREHRQMQTMMMMNIMNMMKSNQSKNDIPN